MPTIIIVTASHVTDRVKSTKSISEIRLQKIDSEIDQKIDFSIDYEIV